MSTSNDPIRLEKSDLYTPQVESYLDTHQALRQDIGEINRV